MIHPVCSECCAIVTSPGKPAAALLAVRVLAVAALLAGPLAFTAELQTERNRALAFAAEDTGKVQFIDPDNATASSKAVVVGPATLAHTVQLLPLDRRGRIVGANKADEQA